MVETTKSKAKRMIVFAFVGILTVLFVSAFAGGLAQEAASTQTHSLILGNSSSISYAWGENNTTNGYTPLPISTLAVVNGTGPNGTYNTLVDNNYYASATVNNTTTNQYDLVNLLVTNMTLGQMNTYAVNKVVFATTGLSGNYSAVLGDGSSYTDFTPITVLSVSGSNATGQNLTFAITPAMITGNQSADLMLKLEFHSANAPVSYNVNPQVTGVKSTLFGYTTAEDIAYVVASGLLIVSIVMVVPFHDFSMKHAYNRMTTARKQKKGEKRRKNSNKGNSKSRKRGGR